MDDCRTVGPRSSSDEGGLPPKSRSYRVVGSSKRSRTADLVAADIESARAVPIHYASHCQTDTSPRAALVSFVRHRVGNRGRNEKLASSLPG